MSTTKDVAVGILSFLAGIGIGLLLAPKSGKELRTDIGESAKEALDVSVEASKEAAHAAKEAANAALAAARKIPSSFKDMEFADLDENEIQNELVK